MTASAVWKIAYERLKQRDSENDYGQLGDDVLPLRLDGSILVLGTPDAYFGEWLKFCCGDLLTEALLQIEGVDYTYSIEVMPAKKKSPKAERIAAQSPGNEEYEQLELFSLDDEVAGDCVETAAAAPVLPVANAVAFSAPVPSPQLPAEKPAAAAGLLR